MATEESALRAKSSGGSPRLTPRQSTSTPPSGLRPIRLKQGGSKVGSQNPSAVVSSNGPPKPLCYSPVTPRSPKDMIGAHTELSTGIVYPYNMFGPCNPGKFGHLQKFPPFRAQKEHYGGKQEKLAKDRLGKRRFGHIRHHCYYKSLIEPENTQSLAWADPKRKEYWRTDVERDLKRDEEKRKARQKELLAIWTNEEAWRRHNALKMRDLNYQAYLDLNENLRMIGCRNNQSGAPHINIITREPIGEHQKSLVNYKQDVAKYKAAARSLFLQSKNSGVRNYNILNWQKNAPGPGLPPWPEKPPTPPPPPPPDTRTPLNSSKGAMSFGSLYGPFGSISVP